MGCSYTFSKLKFIKILCRVWPYVLLSHLLYSQGYIKETIVLRDYDAAYLLDR